MGGCLVSVEQQDDKRVYADYLIQQGEVADMKTPDHTRYVISAYMYFRSRLLTPGRCYEDDNHGNLAIGGSAHADVIDLDMWLAEQSEDTQREALDWALGSSLEQIAYWRGLRGDSGVRKRRKKLIDKRAKSANPT